MITHMYYAPISTIRMNLLHKIALTAGVICLMTNAPAAVITQTGNDASGESSFNTGIHWPSNLAPTAGNSYVSFSFLRTPATSGSYTFAGDSLTLGNGSTLVYKGTSASDIITINDLRLQTGSRVTAAQPNSFTLAGNIAITGTGNFFINNGSKGYKVNSAISGGSVRITTDQSTQVALDQAVTFTHANNTYTGDTKIETRAFLVSQADGALGLGNVLLTGGKITLELGATNNYIADTASFLISSSLANGSVNLNYAGYDVIGALSLDGGSTFLSSGSYTATQLNTLYGSSLFTGAGGLTVVPEPSTVALLAGAFCGLLFYRKRRNQKAPLNNSVHC